MKIIEYILLGTGSIAWLCAIGYLLYILYCGFSYYLGITIGKCYHNLLIAYEWYRMPIEELNVLWEKNSRHGYLRIRHCKKYVWVSRYVLVKRVRKYRKQLNSHE